MIGPPKMQAADIKRVHDAVTTAFTSPEVREAMDKQGNIIKPTSPEQAASYFRSEAARYAALVKKANVVVE